MYLAINTFWLNPKGFNIYIAFPAVYLAQRLPTGKFSAIAIMIWGAVTMTTAGVKTYAGLIVQRFTSYSS